MAGKAAHMHFVDDRPRGGPVERHVAFPIVGARIGHHALHRRRAIVAFLPGSFATVILRQQRCRVHMDRGELWRDRSACRSKDRRSRQLDSHRSARLSRPARIHASSDMCGWLRDRCGSHARAEHHRRNRREEARCRCVLRVDAKVCPSRRKCRSERRTPAFGGFLCHCARNFRGSQNRNPELNFIRNKQEHSDDQIQKSRVPEDEADLCEFCAFAINLLLLSNCGLRAV